ncbi:hypothetical protein [Aeromicrobium duanguangcaii]|uniref:hypothetical protein n=1 Tax=Aeromicrobium duanguangcaii TaxID=2968086 RepID=UPI002016DA73|nr:hypothetical protein [Aeromicrobium duanguangcaii]
MAAVARDEDPLRLIDPEFLDLRIVEEPLQRTESHQVRHQLTHHMVRLIESAHRTSQAALLVLGHRIAGGATHRIDVGTRIDPPLANQSADPIGQDLHVLPPESRCCLACIMANGVTRSQGPNSDLWMKGRKRRGAVTGATKCG